MNGRIGVYTVYTGRPRSGVARRTTGADVRTPSHRPEELEVLNPSNESSVLLVRREKGIPWDRENTTISPKGSVHRVPYDLTTRNPLRDTVKTCRSSYEQIRLLSKQRTDAIISSSRWTSRFQPTQLTSSSGRILSSPKDSNPKESTLCLLCSI